MLGEDYHGVVVGEESFIILEPVQFSQRIKSWWWAIVFVNFLLLRDFSCVLSFSFSLFLIYAKDLMELLLNVVGVGGAWMRFRSVLQVLASSAVGLLGTSNSRSGKYSEVQLIPILCSLFQLCFLQTLASLWYWILNCNTCSIQLHMALTLYPHLFPLYACFY